MIKRVLITKVDHFLKVLFFACPTHLTQIWKTQTPPCKMIKTTTGMLTVHISLFYFDFSICASLQPILTFERIRGGSFLQPLEGETESPDHSWTFLSSY